MGTSQDGVTKNVHYHRYVNMILKNCHSELYKILMKKLEP